MGKFKNYFINIFLIVFSTYIPLLTLEIFLALKGPTFKRSSPLSYREKLDAIKNEFKPFYLPNQFPQKDQPFLSIGSLPNSNTFYCDEGYGLITFKTDRFGLRNKDSKWSDILIKENIFVLGDSFVQGQCVKEDYTITNKIQEKSYFNTLNIGVSGSNPYHYFANLNVFLKPIIENLKNRSFILLVFYDNDYIERNFLKEAEIKKNNNYVVNINQNSLSLKSDYKDFLLSKIKKYYPFNKDELTIELKEKYFKDNIYYQILTLRKTRKKIKYLINKPKRELSIYPSKLAISKLLEICEKDCLPLIMYIPSSNFWDKNVESGIFKRKLKNLSNIYNISFIDGEEVINRNNLKDYSPNSLHLSEKGYEKIANLILKNIKK